MFKVLRRPMLFVSLLIGLISCSKSEKNPFGLEKVNESNLVDVKYVDLVGSESELSLSFPVGHIGTSDDLLLGIHKGVRSGIALRYNAVADSITGEVQSATIVFLPSGRVSSDSLGTIDVSTYEILAGWDSENIDPAFILGNIGSQTFGDGTLGTSVLVNDSLNVSAELVQSWADGTTANNGLIVFPNETESMNVYNSDETANGPILRVSVLDNNVSREIIFRNPDASSVFETLPEYELPEDRLTISTGLASATFLKFDLPELSENTTINYARIVLHVDTVNTVFPFTESSLSITRMFTNTSDWETSPSNVDSTVIGLTSYNATASLVINMADMIQLMAADKRTNFGFRFAPTDLTSNIFRTVLFSSAAADTSLRPSLELFYTVPGVRVNR